MTSETQKEIISDEHRKAFLFAFSEYYKGEQSAINLSIMLLEVVHVWDDFIDGDPVAPENIDRVFRYLIYDIPVNPVYKLIPSLPDHMLNVYLRWRDATAMEKEKTPDLEKTYMLRAGIYDIFILIAHHLYGEEWSRDVGVKVRKMYGETLSSLKEEFKNA